MHLMPALNEIQSFVGDEIGQICLDPFSIQFKLDRCSMTLEHGVEHVNLDGVRARYNCVARDGPPLLLHQLLQVPIVSVDRQDLEFTLRFRDGQMLTIHTEIGPYESGQIYFMDENGATRDFIVF
jgi:hypothetical protein